MNNEASIIGNTVATLVENKVNIRNFIGRKKGREAVQQIGRHVFVFIFLMPWCFMSKKNGKPTFPSMTLMKKRRDKRMINSKL